MSLVQSARPLQLALAQPRLAGALLVLNVTGLLLAGLWLRVGQLDHVPGINGDEAWYGIQAMRLFDGQGVAWRTPTNNILNPFFFVPLAALHAFWPPSAAMLRYPALLSGVLALVVNYWLCCRTFDRRTALATTLLLAVLPVNIAYSRFGWDTSQTLLATLPAVYLPLLAVQEANHRQRWLIAAAAAFVASMVVHPTNIFTAPLLAIPLLWSQRLDLLAAVRRPRPLAHWLGVGFIVTVGLAAVGWLARHWLATICSRLASPAELWEFAWHYQRLFSGLTVYRYLAGSNLPAAADGPDWLVLDLAWWSLFALAACGLWRSMRQPDERRWRDGCLIAAWATMLAGFCLVAGPAAIAPHYERYALCLVAPAAVLMGRAITWWCWRAETRLPALAAILSLGWLTLWGFHEHYFEFIHRTGGASHETFRTSGQEPKQAALAQVLRQRRPGQTAWIVAAEYWNEKPLAYLAAGKDGLRVENWLAVRDSEELLAAAGEGRAWFVEFAGTSHVHDVQAWLERHGIAWSESQIPDFAGRPVLTILAPLADAAH